MWQVLKGVFAVVIKHKTNGYATVISDRDARNGILKGMSFTYLATRPVQSFGPQFLPLHL